jgi:hypothetical protein
LLENPPHDTGADAELPADLEDAVAAGPQFQYSRFNRRLDATPPEFRSFRHGARETGIDPLSDNFPLKLSKYTQHLKHRLAGGRRTIESTREGHVSASRGPRP